MPLVRPGVLGMDGEILQFWEARKLLKEKRVFHFAGCLRSGPDGSLASEAQA